ncbi:AlpA family phage regulatory protein [Ruegeria sp. PrR005]|uniref:AlpA family phage regulatory protein n=1 Tax=Ruegeria sp. PrR005 TaxID=2706882 RepID=A0A6B2NTX4_9RHOB|nr:AlpA family phage regulatory protein [Ruegeria sp. PrR005]
MTHTYFRDTIAPRKTHTYLPDTKVAERYDVHRTTPWRWAKTDPSFPKPVVLSPGCTRWRLADLEAWEQSREVAE